MPQGRTNIQYLVWLCSNACDDCNCVREINIRYIDGSEQTIDNNSEICELMHAPVLAKIATYQELRYSGHSEEEGEWYAIDARVTVNLERTVNNGIVPVKVKVPIGA